MDADPAADLVLVSKSPWDPAVRREHALVRHAARAGHGVVFVEQPLDVRAIASSPRRYLSALPRPVARPSQAGVRVVGRSTLVPGHRSSTALRVETRLLERDLRVIGVDRAPVVVATTPWHWPAVEHSLAPRKVVDLADDWTKLIPERATLLSDLHRRIADSADEIIVVSPDLGELFPGRSVRVVPNGVDDRSAQHTPRDRPRRNRLVAVGTLSERVDVGVLRELLAELPDWTLDLYGEARFPGTAGRPSAEMASLIADSAGRIRWHGPVDRDRLRSVLDSADVLLIAHRRQYTTGQDSMKLYDYAGSGRPVVCTAASVGAITRAMPGLEIGDTAAQLAAAVRRADRQDVAMSFARHRWVQQHRWADRWADWWSAVSGQQSDRGAAA